MPAELKGRLSDEVRRTGRSLNDVAVGILASRFAVSFEPSGRAGKAPGDGSSVLLRMPAELKDRLGARAAQRRRNVNDLIVETLTERLGKAKMGTTNGKGRRSERRGPRADLWGGDCGHSLLQGGRHCRHGPADPLF